MLIERDGYMLKAKPAVMKLSPVESASSAIGTLSSGFRLFGFTKGQFSLLDLVRAVLSQTGPADVVVSTWTTGIRDAENAEALLDNGIIRSFLLLTDRSFPTRQPQYCQRILEIFGEQSIRVTRTHAKFALIRNERWNVAIRSSMNLNRNPRFEQYDIDDDTGLCDFIMGHVTEIWDLQPSGLSVPTREVDNGFRQALGGGLSEVYDLADDCVSPSATIGDL